jgi:hypothetical protein
LSGRLLFKERFQRRLKRADFVLARGITSIDEAEFAGGSLQRIASAHVVQRP